MVGSVSTGNGPISVSWSSDGRFIAVGIFTSSTLQIFSVNGGIPSASPVGSVSTSGPRSVSWSSDGRFIAVVGSSTSLQIFSFSGSGNPALVGSASTGSTPYSVSWSPDGRYLAVVNNAGLTLQIFSFSGSGNPTLVGSVVITTGPQAVSWSPDGRFIAVCFGSIPYSLQIFSFYGLNPALVGSVNPGTQPYSVSWSPDGRYLAVADYTSSLQICSFSGSGNPTLVGSSASASGNPRSVSWSPDGRFIALVTYNSGTLQIFSTNYVVDRSTQALSSSIVFGNSAAGSASDLSVQLLSGANVSVDGILNYDNTLGYTMFSNNNASFVLKNSNSEIRMTPNTVVGWQDGSIISNVSNAGLGDYNLISDVSPKNAQIPTNLINYSGVPNTLVGSNWNIPANTIVHVSNNAVLDGNGNTISIGANSEIFVDDTITLTLRNVVVDSTLNGPGNPAIKLASNRSQLVLDNATLIPANDFYFDRGKLFAYNDVNINGTNAFIYRSTMPSYIKSGANFKFNPSTTFDFRPSTTGTSGLLAKDLLGMDDASSKITLNGATLKSTFTGMRLTKGQILLDNSVSMTSAASFDLYSFLTTATSTPSYTGLIYATVWSPDGRFVAIGGSGKQTIQVYSFTGSTLNLVAESANYSGIIQSVAWSPDGKYIAAGGATQKINIYSFNGTGFDNGGSPIAQSPSYSGTIESVAWSPDGKYIAAGGVTTQTVQVYGFTGSSCNYLAASASYTATIYSVSWSPNGKYIAAGAAGGASPPLPINIYSFNGTGFDNSGSPIAQSPSYNGIAYSIAWSPDGMYVVAGFGTATSAAKVFYFKNLTSLDPITPAISTYSGSLFILLLGIQVENL